MDRYRERVHTLIRWPYGPARCAMDYFNDAWFSLSSHGTGAFRRVLRPGDYATRWAGGTWSNDGPAGAVRYSPGKAA